MSEPQRNQHLPTLDSAACAGLMDALTALIARAAGAIRNAATGVRHKADGSPVTPADEAAEAVIRDGLNRLVPGMPIISEEHTASQTPTAPARSSESYFLVDPLDGTREFVAGRDEYTINIAVVTAGMPLLGIIAAPALDLAWRGIVGRGAERIAFAQNKISQPTPIRTRPRPKGPLVVLLSRSHLDARTEDYLKQFPRVERIQCGSAIKFCRLAEGSADLYPRLAPTHDWDTAAGHAIVTAAGGRVTAPDGTALVYGTQDLLIPSFLAWGDPLTA